MPDESGDVVEHESQLGRVGEHELADALALHRAHLRVERPGVLVEEEVGDDRAELLRRRRDGATAICGALRGVCRELHLRVHLGERDGAEIPVHLDHLGGVERLRNGVGRGDRLAIGRIHRELPELGGRDGRIVHRRTLPGERADRLRIGLAGAHQRVALRGIRQRRQHGLHDVPRVVLRVRDDDVVDCAGDVHGALRHAVQLEVAGLVAGLQRRPHAAIGEHL